MDFFYNRVLSYFDKPNFIIYNDWFDDNFEKTKLDGKNIKIKTSSKMHEFFLNNQMTKFRHLKIIYNLKSK